MVDARAGGLGQDHDIANYLRISNKKVLLVANKSEGRTRAFSWPSSTSWPWASRLSVSAAHGQGIRSLIDEALSEFFSRRR